MKKLLSYFNIAAFAAITILSSCGKDEEVTPTPTGPTAPALKTYTAKLLGAQLATAGSYFSSADGEVYTATRSQEAANKAKIDITFAQIGAAGEIMPELISPDARESRSLTAYTGGTTTYFAASTINFDNVTPARIDSISKSTNKYIEVNEGGVYEFVNQAGKKGLIKVTDYTAGDIPTTLNGSITIDVKVQE